MSNIRVQLLTNNPRNLAHAWQTMNGRDWRELFQLPFQLYCTTADDGSTVPLLSAAARMLKYLGEYLGFVSLSDPGETVSPQYQALLTATCHAFGTMVGHLDDDGKFRDRFKDHLRVVCRHMPRSLAETLTPFLLNDEGPCERHIRVFEKKYLQRVDLKQSSAEKVLPTMEVYYQRHLANVSEYLLMESKNEERARAAPPYRMLLFMPCCVMSLGDKRAFTWRLRSQVVGRTQEFYWTFLVLRSPYGIAVRVGPERTHPMTKDGRVVCVCPGTVNGPSAACRWGGSVIERLGVDRPHIMSSDVDLYVRQDTCSQACKALSQDRAKQDIARAKAKRARVVASEAAADDRRRLRETLRVADARSDFDVAFAPVEERTAACRVVVKELRGIPASQWLSGQIAEARTCLDSVLALKATITGTPVFNDSKAHGRLTTFQQRSIYSTRDVLASLLEELTRYLAVVDGKDEKDDPVVVQDDPTLTITKDPPPPVQETLPALPAKSRKGRTAKRRRGSVMADMGRRYKR